jgi:predicted nuclease of predicted toxin-antitoxin system
MKILVDMSLSPGWVTALQRHGHAAVHWSKLGDARAADAVILEWARANGYIVLTHDLDFGAILAATRGAAPSVVLVRAQDLLSPALESLVLSALQTCEAKLAAGALVVVDARTARVRLLPLGDAP